MTQHFITVRHTEGSTYHIYYRKILAKCSYCASETTLASFNANYGCCGEVVDANQHYTSANMGTHSQMKVETPERVLTLLGECTR